MAVSEDQKKSAGARANQGYGGLSILLGALMVWQGTKHGDDCNNGAAHFLYVGGIVILIANSLGLLAEIAHSLAMKDGVISKGEKCGLCLITIMKGMMSFVNLCVTLWGSIVVFGAYAYWTYDKEQAAEAYYCPYSPMIFAFVFLIIQWILLPFMIACACLAGMCACLAGAVKSQA